jgi:hypothetical protein
MAAMGVAERYTEEGAKLVELARAFMGQSPPAIAEPAPPAPLATTVDVTRADAEKAGGTQSDLLNAKLIREACVGLGEQGAREVIELLKELRPRDAREALAIRRLVMLDALMVETVALARAAPHPLLRDAYATQACALSNAATHLDEALERRRSGKVGQRTIIVQHLKGGQAVGVVNQYSPAR